MSTIEVHVTVQAGAVMNINPSADAVIAEIDRLRDDILSKMLIGPQLRQSIETLTTKVKAVDDVVIDLPVPSSAT